MAQILLKAGSFVAIIVFGLVLRQTGFFQERDFAFLSKIVLRITLPAAIIMNFSGQTFELSLLTMALVGLGWNLLSVLLGYLVNRGKSPREKAFGMLNITGYNIGNFALPFIREFLGPAGVIATSIFDTGNAMICLGGNVGFASMVVSGGGFSLRRLLTAMGKSVSFMTYLVMLTLSLLKLQLPGPILSVVQIGANANTFLAMLMLGVGFRLKITKDQLWTILRYLGIRYCVAAAFAALAWWVLPFAPEIRRVLVLLAFSPVTSSAPGFSHELKLDSGLSATINSLTILISIAAMTALLAVTAG